MEIFIIGTLTFWNFLIRALKSACGLITFQKEPKLIIGVCWVGQPARRWARTGCIPDHPQGPYSGSFYCSRARSAHAAKAKRTSCCMGEKKSALAGDSGSRCGRYIEPRPCGQPTRPQEKAKLPQILKRNMQELSDFVLYHRNYWGGKMAGAAVGGSWRLWTDAPFGKGFWCHSAGPLNAVNKNIGIEMKLGQTQFLGYFDNENVHIAWRYHGWVT